MKRDLWLRIRSYHFDDLVPPHLWDHVVEAFGGTDASTRAFAAKIARKHGWSVSYALRAIAEYRKFLFLGVTGITPVTPPKAIDTVWHEHLLFTRAYRTFCHEVLGRDFDHHPELVPTDEQTSVFAQQYLTTLERYRYEFRIDPPADIWGTPKFDARAVKKEANDGGGGGDPAMAGGGGSGGSDDPEGPLHQQFNGLGDTPSRLDMPEFNADSSGGDVGGDGGTSGDGGGSGCSSGCGGGCGGD